MAGPPSRPSRRSGGPVTCPARDLGESPTPGL